MNQSDTPIHEHQKVFANESDKPLMIDSLISYHKEWQITMSKGENER